MVCGVRTVSAVCPVVRVLRPSYNEMSIQQDHDDRSDRTKYESPSAGWKAVYADLGCSTSVEPSVPRQKRSKPVEPAHRYVLTRADVFVLPWSAEHDERRQAAYVVPLDDDEIRTVGYTDDELDELEADAATVEPVAIADTPAWCCDAVPDEWLDEINGGEAA